MMIIYKTYSLDLQRQITTASTTYYDWNKQRNHKYTGHCLLVNYEKTTSDHL